MSRWKRPVQTSHALAQGELAPARGPASGPGSGLVPAHSQLGGRPKQPFLPPSHHLLFSHAAGGGEDAPCPPALASVCPPRRPGAERPPCFPGWTLSAREAVQLFPSPEERSRDCVKIPKLRGRIDLHFLVFEGAAQHSSEMSQLPSTATRYPWRRTAGGCDVCRTQLRTLTGCPARARQGKACPGDAD